MNTNMSSAILGNNGINAIAIIGNTNAALQLLIASKNEAQVAAFEAETGWTWQTACETSIEGQTATLLASKSAEEIAAFEAETGWTWSDAVDESILADVQARLQAESTTSEDVSTSESDADEFERETGWTLGDATDMAAECRRDDRFFGRRH
ncbi:hypothetical protein BH11CYA1_BH11CYA1_07980 [soil metagenome]